MKLGDQYISRVLLLVLLLVFPLVFFTNISSWVVAVLIAAVIVVILYLMWCRILSRRFGLTSIVLTTILLANWIGVYLIQETLGYSPSIGVLHLVFGLFPSYVVCCILFLIKAFPNHSESN